jgi:hypothetical protein
MDKSVILLRIIFAILAFPFNTLFNNQDSDSEWQLPAAHKYVRPAATLCRAKKNCCQTDCSSDKYSTVGMCPKVGIPS